METDDRQGLIMEKRALGMKYVMGHSWLIIQAIHQLLDVAFSAPCMILCGHTPTPTCWSGSLGLLVQTATGPGQNCSNQKHI